MKEQGILKDLEAQGIEDMAIPCACTVLNLIIISKKEEAGYGIAM